ncbi:Non-structural maintenance of chromosomes element 3 homolog [Anthophora quadrimaculata]
MTHHVVESVSELSAMMKGMPRKYKTTMSRKSLSQFSTQTQNYDASSASFSQPAPSTSTAVSGSHLNRRSQKSFDRLVSEEENQLVNSVIRYFLVVDREKQAISKASIIKNVFGNQGKHFHGVMNKVQNLLSKIFGYRLVELESYKYILVNEIQNELPHIQPTTKEASQQVLLLIILTHIFMHDESCSEELLLNFLTNLGITYTDNQFHPYFGNIKHLITEVFVAQKYLDKTITIKDNLSKAEFKWGPRAEHEFSRRAALNFVSEIYNGCPINSWPFQYKAAIARE